jgi:hypothetical protein
MVFVSAPPVYPPTTTMRSTTAAPAVNARGVFRFGPADQLLLAGS